MRTLVVLTLIAIGCGTAWSQTPTGAEARLKEKNIQLPSPPTPVANYVGSVRTGNLLFLAGTGPGPDWRGKGKVGKDLTLDEGYQAARLTGLYLLATTRQALGSLDKVKRVIKVLGMVNSAPGFTDQPKVINGNQPRPIRHWVSD